MNLRALRFLAIASIAVAGSLSGGQSLAQNAYIANLASNSVSVIDTATNTVSATIGGFSLPYGVAATSDGRKVYVTNLFPASVSVIDTATRMITATIPLGVGVSSLGVAVNPDASKVYA